MHTVELVSEAKVVDEDEEEAGEMPSIRNRRVNGLLLILLGVVPKNPPKCLDLDIDLGEDMVGRCQGATTP